MTSGIRIPPVVPGTRPELAAIEREIVQARGEILLLYQVLLNSPPLAAGWEKLMTAIRKQSTVPPDLRELVILRVAILNRAAYEFEAHVPHARRAGVADAKIEAVRHWRGVGAASGNDVTFSADETLVLELADAMTREVEVPSALMDRVLARFDARGVLEVVATVAAYNMVSRLLVALNIEH
jgi:4-carboxymuconolactone decarboxylase